VRPFNKHTTNGCHLCDSCFRMQLIFFALCFIFAAEEISALFCESLCAWLCFGFAATTRCLQCFGRVGSFCCSCFARWLQRRHDYATPQLQFSAIRIYLLVNKVCVPRCLQTTACSPSAFSSTCEKHWFPITTTLSCYIYLVLQSLC